MSRILVYVAFATLIAAIGFVFAVPAEYRDEGVNARRLQAFITVLQQNPHDLQNVHLINGQSQIVYTLVNRQPQSVVIPIEWKSQLIQYCLDKHVQFTVQDPDLSWLYIAGAAALAVAYFQFVLMPNLTHRACPQCAERVLSAARICRYCGVELIPVLLLRESEEIVEEELDSRAADEDFDQFAETDVQIPSQSEEPEPATLEPTWRNAESEPELRPQESREQPQLAST